MRVSTSLLAFALSVGAGVLMSCGPTTGSKACGVGTCQGCCDASGQCMPGNASTACGNNGLTCSTCALGQLCSLGACRAPGVGGNGATGGFGGQGGGSAGRGGSAGFGGGSAGFGGGSAGFGGGSAGFGGGGGGSAGTPGTCTFPSQTCNFGYRCMLNPQSQSACIQSACDLVNTAVSGCSSGQTCGIPASGPSAGSCRPLTGSLQAGATCDPASDQCGAGTQCIAITGQPAACTRFCNGTNDCPTGFKCESAISVPGISALFPICTAATTCNALTQTGCTSGQSCQISNSGAPLCSTAGPAQLHQTCGLVNGAALHCVAGTQCFGANAGDQTGFCYKLCNVSGGSPTCPSGTTCQDLSAQGVGICSA